jgi:hypothetical protein
LDFTELVNAFLCAEGDACYDPNADFNDNGVVNGLDFTDLVNNFLVAGPRNAP